MTFEVDDEPIMRSAMSFAEPLPRADVITMGLGPASAAIAYK